MHVVHSGLTGC